MWEFKDCVLLNSAVDPVDLDTQSLVPGFELRCAVSIIICSVDVNISMFPLLLWCSESRVRSDTGPCRTDQNQPRVSC